MSIDWSTVLTHFPLLDDDKERVVSWKEPDSRAKGGDASGPFRILSLANSANTEGALVPVGRVYLAGSPFINLAVFEPQAVKYDNRCEAMENRVSGDKFQQKKRTRGHSNLLPARLLPFDGTKFAKVTTAITFLLPIFCPHLVQYPVLVSFPPEKFANYSCGDCNASCRIVNLVNKYVSRSQICLFFLYPTFSNFIF